MFLTSKVTVFFGGYLHPHFFLDASSLNVALWSTSFSAVSISNIALKEGDSDKGYFLSSQGGSLIVHSNFFAKIKK